MAFTVNPPTATVGNPYSCVILPTSGYKEYAGPSVNTATKTMTFSYLSTGGSGSYKWNLGAVRIAGPEDDAWEFIFQVSADGGRSYTIVERKKPVMMSTSGGGGTITIPGKTKYYRSIWDSIFWWKS